MTDDRDITDDVMEQWREICEESPAQSEKECADLEIMDEEMAANWVKENADSCRSANMNAREFAEHAFLAGLNTGRLQWHDLRKDPNDLPDNSRYVWTNEGPGYYDTDAVWRDDFGRLHNVIAWCEPKYLGKI